VPVYRGVSDEERSYIVRC